MKKIFLLLVFLMSSTFSFAQNVSKDKTEEDGSRVILSLVQNLYSKWSTAAAFYLAYMRSANGSEEWSLEIILNEGKDTIDKGRKMLIKTEDGEMFVLENNKEIGPADYEFEVTRHGYTIYYLRPSYLLSEEQLRKLCSSNIIKIRIETDNSSFDRDINPKKFSKAINKMYQAINSAKSVENTIYDDF